MKEVLVHLLVTIRYRFDHVTAEIGDDYPQFYLGYGVRTPLQILYHMRGLIYYAKKILTGQMTQMAEMSGWEEEVQLFYASLNDLKDTIRYSEISRDQMLRITQGPISDALTHIGQMAMLNRVNGTPVEKHNYSKAKI